MFVIFVKKGNGVIDFDEFKDMLDKTKSIADPDADLREAFKVFDLDGDGIITVIKRRLKTRTKHVKRIFSFPN